ncbi:MAG: hypothetical protein HOC70_00300 [Gammaproteobacteria bacterium]|jgi:hypothetical protein|nr:hypothetical protein [Gammaproteobacteria bacterium]MBT4491653.1 hypothetical protein [Gammaproteobacteria bacterium]
MLFLFGESVRSKCTDVGSHDCGVCRGRQPFTEQIESLWFCLFAIPLIRIEDRARYWRCENCLSAFDRNNLEEPAHVPLVKRVIAYLLLGYRQDQHESIASEICLKITGFEYSGREYKEAIAFLDRGDVEMADIVRTSAPAMNAIGKQAVLEAAFLTTYLCCDMQYEDRLRINLIGNSLDVGLEFVEYAIQQTRKQNYYGVRRLMHSESVGSE